MRRIWNVIAALKFNDCLFLYEQLRWRPTPIGTKQDWQDRLKSIGIGRKGVEDTEKAENSNMAVPFYDENLYLLNMKNDLEAKVRILSTLELQV